MDEKRLQFEAICAEIPIRTKRKKRTYTRVTCPCCGYPTLDQRGQYEICHLCHWEDDGSDDLGDGELLGGPNHGVALPNARKNFDRYLVMYKPNKDPRVSAPDTELTLQLKQQLMDEFELLLLMEQQEQQGLWDKIFELEKAIFAELKRQLNEHKG